MTHDEAKGFKRGADGVLEQSPARFSRHYKDPGEAIKTWWAGELRLGCTERRFENYSSFPCGKPAKHDPDHNGNPTKCGVHCAAAKEKREAKRRAKEVADRAKWRRQNELRRLSQEAQEIIRQIAEGHNDSRYLCQDWINRRTKVETGE